MISETPENAALNRHASEWMHRGMDLALEDSPAALTQAVRCFDKAIALRRTLPLEKNPHFRYGLSAGWINRGDALARLGGESLEEAIKSYNEALALLETLPLEDDPLYPRRLAITWINRGRAVQMWQAGFRESERCFRKAIEVLEQRCSTGISDRTALLAGAWTNLAGALVGQGDEEAATARLAAQRAIKLVKPFERNEAVSAETGLNARHTLCRLAVKDIADKKAFTNEAVALVTDAVDEGLDLAADWKFAGQATGLGRDIFRFGCRIYENLEPHFLAEFVMENLTTERFGGALPLDQNTFDSAQAAIWGVLAQLQREGFKFVASAQLEPVLADIEKLRQVEERLNSLRGQGTTGT